MLVFLIWNVRWAIKLQSAQLKLAMSSKCKLATSIQAAVAAGYIVYVVCLHSNEVVQPFLLSDSLRSSLVPDLPGTCEKEGLVFWTTFSCQMRRDSFQSWELESDCRTHDYMQWHRQSSTRSSFLLGIILHAACNAWRNAIITFFMLFDPAPCDKNSHSEHQTLFLTRAGRIWTRDCLWSWASISTVGLPRSYSTFCH